MKTNLIKSLEEISEDLESIDDTSNMMHEQESSDWILRASEDVLVDAEVTQSILQEMDAAATPEEAVCIAKEHLLNRIGYVLPVSVDIFTVANEDFKTKFDFATTLAQESIFNKIGSAIDTSISNDIKLADQISKAGSGIRASGGNEKTLASSGWGSIFAESGKDTLTASDVISSVKKYKGIVSGSTFKSLASKVEEMLTKISNEPDRNWFVANKNSTDQVKSLSEITAKMKKDIDSISVKGKSKKSVSIAALTPAQASDLSKEILEILKHDKLENISKVLKQKAKSGENTYNVVSSFRYQKESPEDVKEAKKSIDAFRAVLQDLKDFLLYKSKVCYSSLQYIKASTK